MGVFGCDAQVEPAYGGEPLISIDGRVEAPLSVGDVDVGILWLRSSAEAVDIAVECTLELSGEAPSACVAACGVPSCDDVTAFDAWSRCTEPCEGPTGVSSSIVNVYADLRFEGAVGQTTPVEGAFPAEFSLDVLAPPPDEALITANTGERVALGFFVALDPAGAPFQLDAAELPSFPPWLLGGSESHVMVFTPDGFPANASWGVILGGAFEPGFHLMDVVHETTTNDRGEVEQDTTFVPVPAGDATLVDLTVGDPTLLDWPLTDLFQSGAER
jgi:hypothetical protein